MAMRRSRTTSDASNAGMPRTGGTAATPVRPSDDEVASLVPYLEDRGVLVLDRRPVVTYMRKHPDLLPVVRRVADAAVERLGDRCELSLELYRDPEHGGKHLSLYAREWPNQPGLQDVIDVIMQEYWQLPPETSGWFYLTMDFQWPRRR